MVYVINRQGTPLMPTCNHGKARIFLKTGKAKVVRRTPFTIQLLYDTTRFTQEITLGVDAGSKITGLSATTANRELYGGEVELRNDIVSLLSDRRALRRSRRNRKTRYRKARFDNRVHSKHKGWLAPSIENKIQTHIKAVADLHRILPVTSIIVETAAFDTQRLKAEMEEKMIPQGTDYQNGEQLGFWNVREYVLFRDGHTCQRCKGKSKDRILNVHHIESRKTGGDAPGNLITLCESCHKAYHAGLLPEFRPKRQPSFRDAAFMGIMRRTFFERLREKYPCVSMTFGYLTKNTRIRSGLSKEHYIDARCISGNPLAEPLGYYFYQKKVRCHNRQIHKLKILKGGIRKRNQSPYTVKGFRLFDKVRYKGKECFIFGRRATGYFDLRTLNGEKLSAGAGCKKLQLLETRRTLLTERRDGHSSPAYRSGNLLPAF